MDSSTNEFLSLAGAAPLIAIIIGVFLKPLPKIGAKIDGRTTPLVSLALAVAWGAILETSGHSVGDAAVFIVSAILVASAASGLQSWSKEAVGKN